MTWVLGTSQRGGFPNWWSKIGGPQNGKSDDSPTENKKWRPEKRRFSYDVSTPECDVDHVPKLAWVRVKTGEPTNVVVFSASPKKDRL